MDHDGPKKKCAMDPAKLNQYIDSPSTFNIENKIRPATDPGTIRRSWNDENCNMTPFSRLDKRGRVVLLENDNIHQNVLGNVSSYNSDLQIRCHEMEIIQRPGDSQPGMRLLVSANESVQNNTLVSPTRVSYTFNAPSRNPEGIMHPAQRREQFELENKVQHATTIKKRAEMKERRLTQLMQHQYPCGVLGLDGPNNPNSKTYAESYNRIEKGQKHARVQNESREAFLRTHTSIIPSLGYSYLEHDMGVKPPRVTKVCQEKIKMPGGRLDTHHRIFNETPPVWHPERAQHLRDEGQAGRPYDIVNKGRIEYFSPSIPEKQHPRQAHPSISIHSIYKHN